MKKIRGDKPIRIIIHTCMEMSQGNSLYSYLYLKPKCHVFHFLFFLLQNQRKGGHKSCPAGRTGTSGKGEVLGKWGRRMNMVQ
jgi:hypothetical protein